jgi:hypothetical protein
MHGHNHAMMFCTWEGLTKGSKCLNGCGYSLKRDYEKAPIRNCKTAEPASPRLGLGDQIESALTAIGFTKERWLDTKESIGLPRTCNCTARQEWLNTLGEKLGEKAKNAVAALFPKGIKLKD